MRKCKHRIPKTDQAELISHVWSIDDMKMDLPDCNKDHKLKLHIETTEHRNDSPSSQHYPGFQMPKYIKFKWGSSNAHITFQ